MRGKGNAFVVLLCLVLAIAATGKEQVKPWTQWTLKDVEKILNDSAWGKTQTETDTRQMTVRPGAGGVMQPTSVNYRIRFLSAKPIRQALLRMLELNRSKSAQEQVGRAQEFVDRKYDSTIVIAVNFERYTGADEGTLGPIRQAFGSATTSLLANNTYLEIKGKRLFLQEYQAPSGDDLGGKFIVPRLVDDKPFIDPKGGEVRFVAPIPRGITINMRFRISDFMYEGTLEY